MTRAMKFLGVAAAYLMRPVRCGIRQSECEDRPHTSSLLQLHSQFHLHDVSLCLPKGAS